MTTLHTQPTAEQPGEGPRNGGMARSATGKKGVKRRHDTKRFEVKYQAIMEVEKGLESKNSNRKIVWNPGHNTVHVVKILQIDQRCLPEIRSQPQNIEDSHIWRCRKGHAEMVLACQRPKRTNLWSNPFSKSKRIRQSTRNRKLQSFYRVAWEV